MSNPALLDFDAILAPISEANPCGTQFETGENPGLSRAFNELRPLTPIARKIEAKRFEIASLAPRDREYLLRDNQGNSDGPQADPKWNRIAELAIEIFSNHSKDTRVMVSLIESMTRLHGLDGLRDSLKACSMLLERYQLGLYPNPPADMDNDSGKPAVAHYCLEIIARICESDSSNIKAAIYQVEVFEESQGFSWLSYILATNIEKLSAAAREEYIQAQDTTLSDFNSALNSIEDPNKLIGFDLQIAEALSEAKNFDNLLNSHSKGRVSIKKLIEYLNGLKRWYGGLIADRLKVISIQVPIQTETSEVGNVAPTGTFVNAPSSPNQLGFSSRKEALESLLRIAEYLKQTEPTT